MKNENFKKFAEFVFSLSLKNEIPIDLFNLLKYIERMDTSALNDFSEIRTKYPNMFTDRALLFFDRFMERKLLGDDLVNQEIQVSILESSVFSVGFKCECIKRAIIEPIEFYARINLYAPYFTFFPKSFRENESVKLSMELYEKDPRIVLENSENESVKSTIGFSDDLLFDYFDKFDWEFILSKTTEPIPDILLGNYNCCFKLCLAGLPIRRECNEAYLLPMFDFSKGISSNIEGFNISLLGEILFFQKWGQPGNRSKELKKIMIKTRNFLFKQAESTYKGRKLKTVMEKLEKFDGDFIPKETPVKNILIYPSLFQPEYIISLFIGEK